MTDDAIGGVARATAAQLSTHYGPNLLTEVEMVLHAPGDRQRKNYYDLSSAVSVANLIVAIATLAWTIYIDQRQKTPEPSPDAVARAIREELRARGSDADPAVQTRIVSVVVAETFRSMDE